MIDDERVSTLALPEIGNHVGVHKTGNLEQLFPFSRA